MDLPVAHIDDSDAVRDTIDALQSIHGSSYAFSLDRWDGQLEQTADVDRTHYLFIMRAEAASVSLKPGDDVRGPSPDGPYRSLDGAWAKVSEGHTAEVRPGDVLTVGEGQRPIRLDGEGVCFTVTAEATGYPAPRLSMLRHLGSHPGGCASYEDAFRREALPPHEVEEGDDARGMNRVNQHTLDMRVDRDPGPIKHYHGPVSTPSGPVPHTETALVLPRSAYDLPPFEGEGSRRIRIYKQPSNNPSDSFNVPVQPGSIVVTPATEEQVFGHCFENTFAMLVAVPGFVAPLHMIDA